MKKILIFSFLSGIAQLAMAQKIDSIYFHLYTDSLKKGFYNYINVDGKLSDGSWRPLTASDLVLTANAGRFRGNDLFIDSAYTGDTVEVKAILKQNPSIQKEVIIYIRKRPFTEPLKSNEEILDQIRKQKRKRSDLS